MGFFDTLRKLVTDVPPLVGDLLPARPQPQVPPWDGRTAALTALRDYVCALTFWRSGGKEGPPIQFCVKPENFNIDLPDDNKGTDYASGVVTVVPTGRFRYEATGLNHFLDPNSVDYFQKGTALQVQASYIEQFDLEFACALYQQRRGWKAGMEVAFMPGDGVAALHLRTKFYEQIATFVLKDGALLDSQDEERGRRRVQLGVEMRIQVVKLVSVNTLRPVPVVIVNTDESARDP